MEQNKENASLSPVDNLDNTKENKDNLLTKETIDKAENQGLKACDDFEVDAILLSLKKEEQDENLEQNTQVQESAEQPFEGYDLVESPVETQESIEQPVVVPNAKKKKAKKKKKKASKNVKGKGCVVTLLWLIIIGVLSITLAVLGVFAASDYLGVGKDFIRGRDTHSVQIFIEEGETISEIAEKLENEKVLISRQVFLLYLKLTDRGTDINFGAHDFTTNMGYNEILASLAETAKAEDVSVTIPSGKTVDEILHILEEKGICSYAELRKEAMEGTFDSELVNAIPENDAMYYKLEGYLFPDTYQFYLKDDPHRVLQKLIDNLEEKFTPEMRKKAKEMGYTTHEILTMASVVEMEACGYFEEMPKVSALFYNRLNDWPEGARFLQSDPTMYYEYGEGRYNTYKVEGLPPGPMGSITEEALKAAVYPDETMESYYFVTDSKGAFYYNDTLSAHEETIADLKRKGLWITTPYID